jgi:nucleotide-binding universal stress UspA family protein
MNGDNLVVGVDGGAAALCAVRWAARECAADGGTLVLLHALGHAAGVEPADTERVFAEAEATAHATAAGVTVRRRPERGCPADVLVAASASARLIVLGTNGAADVAGSILGTVGHRVATHACCPVVIVPPAAESVRVDAPVVVGLAPGRTGRAALRFALAHAAARGRTVVGVLAAGDVTGHGRRRHAGPLPLGVQQILAEWPQVPFRVSWVDTDPAAALRALSGDAVLLVLGCHHSDEPWSTRLGPVPTALLDRSAVPIALVGSPEH